jgi:hypothetical protein
MYAVSRLLSASLILLCLAPSWIAQQRGKPEGIDAPDVFRDAPSGLTPHVAALGDRGRMSGRERSVVVGRLHDDTGKGFPVRLTLQLPRLLRLEGVSPGGPPLTFDGTHALSKARSDQALIESLTSDSTEGMLAAIREGAAVRLVARRVPPERSRRRDVPATTCDIFEITANEPSSPANAIRTKTYCFDSATGLLAKTQYSDDSISPPADVETRFSDWTRVDGSAYPARIERFENGNLVFSLTATTISASPRQDPSNFR